MCARRFLLIVVVLTLLVVAGAFAIYQWGGSMLLRSATPKGAFQAPPPQSGPAYSLAASWIARPDMAEAENPALWRPESVPPPTSRPKRVAAFYVHPTTYLRRDRWNAPLSGAAESDARAELFVRSQASAFNSVADIWAPRYRQAAYGAFLLDSKDARAALDIAYGDVRRAFEAFLADVPEWKPIILAGHSQGSLHLTRLLADFGARMEDRLVAAYVVGWPVSTTADLLAIGLPACRMPDQAGCVLSWQSFAEPANPGMILDAWEGTEGPAGVERRRKTMLCVNPLTGTMGGEAPASANPGTLVPTPDLQGAALVPGRVGAHCERGFLLIGGDIPPLGPFVLPGNNYHVYDYALFWSAIRRDAERRARRRLSQ